MYLEKWQGSGWYGFDGETIWIDDESELDAEVEYRGIEDVPYHGDEDEPWEIPTPMGGWFAVDKLLPGFTGWGEYKDDYLERLKVGSFYDCARLAALMHEGGPEYTTSFIRIVKVTREMAIGKLNTKHIGGTMLSLKQAGELAGVSFQAMHERVKNGRILHERVGSRIFIPEFAVADWEPRRQGS